MNASERIHATVRHGEPDRVPMDINASQWVVERLMASTNSNNSKDLLKHLNIDVFAIADDFGTQDSLLISPGHPVLQVDIPTENILAMYDTAYSYGRY